MCPASYSMNSGLVYEYGEGPRLKEGTEDEKSTAFETAAGAASTNCNQQPAAVIHACFNLGMICAESHPCSAHYNGVRSCLRINLLVFCSKLFVETGLLYRR